MSSFIKNRFANFVLVFSFGALSLGAAAQTAPPTVQPTVPPNVSPTVNPSPEIQKVEDPNVKSLNESRPYAPEFIIPSRPTPTAERVGVEQSNQLPLQLDEAITLALQNNNNIDSSRLGVRIAEFNLKAARGAFDPVLASETFYQRSTIPPASTIGGAAATVLTLVLGLAYFRRVEDSFADLV